MVQIEKGASPCKRAALSDDGGSSVEPFCEIIVNIYQESFRNFLGSSSLFKA
jgi:hypothetical protein